MGLAPKPGRGTEQNPLVTITIRGVTKSFYPMNVPLKHEGRFKREIGTPFFDYVVNFDDHGPFALKALWWMARRVNGEPGLSFEQLETEWPADLNLDPDSDDVEVDYDNGEANTISQDDSPEA